MMFSPARAIEVSLWGNRVGALVMGADGYSIFEYDRDFVSGGIEIAPFAMPLSSRIYYARDFELPRRAFSALPGVFADSLPDSFGNKLVIAWMRSQGVKIEEISPLDRLAYVGSRGMGALEYEPEYTSPQSGNSALDMRRLAEEARLALDADLSKMSGTDALHEIIRLGTSAGGAQAKAIVSWNRRTDAFLSVQENLPEGFEHWLVKFSPKALPDQGEREFEIYRTALECGIEMSECRLCEIDGIRHFMTKRFDRDGERRHLVQTYCAMRHLPPSSPATLCTYEGVMETIAALGMGYEAMEQMFRRVVFNIAIGEHDDHTKNISFIMRKGGSWALAPAYDLTAYCESPADNDFFEWTNRHALSVNGKFSSIGRTDLADFGARFGIGQAKEIIEEVFGKCQKAIKSMS